MSEKPDKIKYHVRNWNHYDNALVQRGSLTVWVDSKVRDTWRDMNKPAGRGRPRTYSNIAIECMMTLREVYRLPNRAAEGLTRSIMELLELDLPAADHTTLSRRGRRVCLKFKTDEKRIIKHLVIDSTGLKVFGEGEWKVRSHGKSKRRTWRKLHLSIDAETNLITAAVITDNSTLDRKEVSNLLDQTSGEIEQVCADGAYDFVNCYGPIENRGAVPLIPPRSNAVIRGRKPFLHRDDNLRHIRKQGMKEWKMQSGYHKRSLSETGIFRLKTIFDDRLNARRIDTQSSQALIRCLALNRMSELGMPDSFPVL